MTGLDAIVQPLIQALTGAEKVIFADQNAPRPALPYWTIRLSANRMIGNDEKSSSVDINGIQNINGVREVTVQIQRYGKNSRSVCEDIKNEMSKQTVLDTWWAAKIAPFNIGDVQDVAFKLDGEQLEPRASLDFFIRFGTLLTDDVGAVDQIQTQVQFDSKPGLTETLNIVL